MRLRQICISLASAVVLVVLTVVSVDLFKQSQELAATPVGGTEERSELRQLKQLEAELASLKALSASAKGSDRERMEAQLNALKQEVSRLGKTLTTIKPTRDAAAPEVSSNEPTSVAERIAVEEEQSRQLAQFLDGALATEAADPAWSVAAAQEISGSVKNVALEHTQLGEVRCASTFCRIEASHDSRDAEQGFIMQLGRLESFRQSEGFAQRAERSDGSVTTTMFVSRSGQRLPNRSAGGGS